MLVFKFWDPKGRTFSWHGERRESRIKVLKSNKMKSAPPVYTDEMNFNPLSLTYSLMVKIVIVSPPEECYKN